jgi:hypothetical protein
MLIATGSCDIVSLLLLLFIPVNVFVVILVVILAARPFLSVDVQWLRLFCIFRRLRDVYRKLTQRRSGVTIT